MHDDGGLGISSPGANNQFDYLDGEYATSTRLSASHGARLDDLSTALGVQHQRFVLLRIGLPLQRDDFGHALRETGQQSSEPADLGRRRADDRDPGGRRRSIRRADDDCLGHGHSAQRSRGTAAAQSRSASHQGRQALRHASRRPSSVRSTTCSTEPTTAASTPRSARRTRRRRRCLVSRCKTLATRMCRAGTGGSSRFFCGLSAFCHSGVTLMRHRHHKPTQGRSGSSPLSRVCAVSIGRPAWRLRANR